VGVEPQVRWEIQWHPAGGGVVRRLLLTQRGSWLAATAAILALIPVVALLALLPLGLRAFLGRVTSGAAQRQNLALHRSHEKLREEAQELAEKVDVLLGRARRLAWLLRVEVPSAEGEELPAGAVSDDELIAWLESRAGRLGPLGEGLAAARFDGKCGLASLPTGPPLDPNSAVPVASYGWRVSPFTNKEEPHYGVTLAAPRGQPVLAPGAARVAYAGVPHERHVNEWSRLGNLVVLDHGCGVYSVLAHLQRVTVRVGRNVARGEQVGTVGTSGWSRVPALYYEIRWPLEGGSRPIDPSLVDIALATTDLAGRLRDPSGGLPDGFPNLKHLRGFR
jgi:murein DD-endopeptidase MepM/ murein hydrolase activator NlpD